MWAVYISKVRRCVSLRPAHRLFQRPEGMVNDEAHESEEKAEEGFFGSVRFAGSEEPRWMGETGLNRRNIKVGEGERNGEAVERHDR